MSSAAQKDVSVTPTSVEEEANDSDHEALDQVAIEPRRSTRIHTAPCYNCIDRKLKYMCGYIDNNVSLVSLYRTSSLIKDGYGF
jgi:hypothetical protein